MVNSIVNVFQSSVKLSLYVSYLPIQFYRKNQEIALIFPIELNK